ncbi:MAG: dTDP-4-dehydrorhamnose reductase [Erysipelotrichaceae bacterium]
MRVLVTGVKGQLGYDVVNELIKRGHFAIGVDIDEMDITDPASVTQVITEANVEAVVHCAAYTAVDKAEEFPELCNRVNVEGTRNIAVVCRELDLKMIYISTDYVFSGTGNEPFGEYDPKAPTNVYGESKLGGELAVTKLVKKHFIVRISWAFGLNGNNFVKTMLKLGKERGSVNVVDDQIGSPTYTYDVARLLVDMLPTEKYGTYHATNEGYCSWYEFAVEIFRYAKMDVVVIPVDSSAFVVKAVRPKNSRLRKTELDQAGFEHLPTWEDALHRYLDQIL